MSRHSPPPFRREPFGLLLVEGGDERSLCKAVAGQAWDGLVCWTASGRDDLPNLARLAARDPNFAYARSVGVLLDMEDDPDRAYSLAQQALAEVGAGNGRPVHGHLEGAPRKHGAFFLPDGHQQGSIEKLCKQAVSGTSLATCVDALVVCAGAPHATVGLGDKGWFNAYLAMLPNPLRFHQWVQDPRGMDPSHQAFAALRAFLSSL